MAVAEALSANLPSSSPTGRPRRRDREAGAGAVFRYADVPDLTAALARWRPPSPILATRPRPGSSGSGGSARGLPPARAREQPARRGRPMSAQLGLGRSIDLAHVLTHHVLADAGVRALRQGAAALAHGFRPPSYMLLRCRRALRSRRVHHRLLGRRATSAGSSIPGNSRDSHLLGAHATTYVVPGWPSTVDLHNHFPGLLARPRRSSRRCGRRAGDRRRAPANPGAAPERAFRRARRQLPALDGGRRRRAAPRVEDGVVLADIVRARRGGRHRPHRWCPRTVARPSPPWAPMPGGRPASRRGLRPGTPSAPIRRLRRRLARPGRLPPLARPARPPAVWDVSLDHFRTPEEWAAAGPWGRSLARVDRARRGGLAVARMTSARLRRPRGGRYAVNSPTGRGGDCWRGERRPRGGSRRLVAWIERRRGGARAGAAGAADRLPYRLPGSATR